MCVYQKSDVIGSKAQKTVILAWLRDHFMAVFGLIRVAASTDGPAFWLHNIHITYMQILIYYIGIPKVT